MYQISRTEKIFDQVLRQTTLSLVFFTSLVASISPQNPTSEHLSSQEEALVIGFDHFSPAFAAFEDEFLFQDEGAVTYHGVLESGRSARSFILAQDRFEQAEDAKKTNDFKNQRQDFYLSSFDGSTSQREIPKRMERLNRAQAEASQLSPQHKQPPARTDLPDRYQADGELRFGPLLAARPTQVSPATESASTTGLARSTRSSQTHLRKSSQSQKKADKTADESMESLAFADLAKNLREDLDLEAPANSYTIKGGISLSEGLAYFGTLEVTWVLGDEVQSMGSVNVPDATYEIQTLELLGEIIVSLYDNNDQLIGEGLVNLEDLRGRGNDIEHNLDVAPINWNLAGQIVHVHSLGAGVEGAAAPLIPIADAQVDLYGLNLATESQKNGAFEFDEWRKSSSRSLALASKAGYRDSIFLLDSRREAKVPLLSESYLQAFFQTLEDQGLYNREYQGMVYGSLQGIAHLSGYQVRLNDQKAIYFNSINMANLEQAATSQNGLFAFVGLEDGDYELTIEKNGEIVDHRVLVVEQGKVTPIVVDLKTLYKHVQFYDPMQPELALGAVDISFFDGVEHHKLDKQQRLQAPLPGGNEPNMIEFAVGQDVARSFISRERGLERLPLMASDQLQKLAEEHEMSLDTGLAFGFVESNQLYEADLFEGRPAKVIYFNEKGAQVDPQKEVPFGFIMGGFYRGLNTLVIRDINGEVIASDLVFSDHNSISVVNLRIFHW